jgi:hypothetical protein
VERGIAPVEILFERPNGTPVPRPHNGDGVSRRPPRHVLTVVHCDAQGTRLRVRKVSGHEKEVDGEAEARLCDVAPAACSVTDDGGFVDASTRLDRADHSPKLTNGYLVHKDEADLTQLRKALLFPRRQRRPGPVQATELLAERGRPPLGTRRSERGSLLAASAKRCPRHLLVHSALEGASHSAERAWPILASLTLVAEHAS